MKLKYNEIKDIILRNIPDVGIFQTSIDGVKIVKRNETTDFLRCFYNPSCILVLQGLKNMLFGDENIFYTKGQYVVSCTDIPVSSRVAEATSEKPFVAMILEINSNTINELIIEMNLTKNVDGNTNALAIADVDFDLLDSFYRLSLLIEKNEAEQKLLAPMIIKEIYFRILTGPLGNQLRLINTKGTRSNQIANAISIIKEKYNEKLNMDNIAQNINMSSSSFYRHFKKVTQVSPQQYQKQLRLNEAKRLMLTGNYDAATASYEVGYESPTQFSREYKKMFGNPPKADIKRLAAV